MVMLETVSVSVPGVRGFGADFTSTMVPCSSAPSGTPATRPPGAS